MEDLDYKTFKIFLDKHHPRDYFNEKNPQPFSLFTSLGYLPVCCFSKKDKEHEAKGSLLANPDEDEIIIEDVQFELGIGASLFMMTVKSLFCFFLLMSILNIPVMLLYYQGKADVETAGVGRVDVDADRRLLEESSQES